MLTALAGGAWAQQVPEVETPSRERMGEVLADRQPEQLPAPVNADFKPIKLTEKFPLITEVPLLRADQVTEEVTRSELVLGVVINGEARAYPLNMLTLPEREIINDSLGGEQIAATWCHLCHSAIVFDRNVNGRVLTFGVSGYLWNRDVVMYDTETSSLWGHMVGEGMQGAMLGTRLTMLPAEMTTWADWEIRYPNSTVLNMSRTASQFQSNFYQQPELFSFGWLVNGNAFHIGFDGLQSRPVRSVTANGSPLLLIYDPATTRAVLASREVDGRVLQIRRNSDGRLRDAETGSIWDEVTLMAVMGPLQGEQLSQEIGIVSYAEAWEDFHPDSTDMGR